MMIFAVSKSIRESTASPLIKVEKGSSSFWVTVHLYKVGVALHNWILIVSGFLIDFQLLVTDSQNNLGVNVHSSN